MEKLPKVFANGIERELNNNLEMFDGRLRKSKIKSDIRKEIDAKKERVIKLQNSFHS